MQPPAEVEPARISQVEQPFSFSAILKMSAARAVSREEKDILRIESMIGRASNEVMSTCSTTLPSSSALALDLRGLTVLAGAAFAAVLAAMGWLRETKDVMGRRPAQSGSRIWWGDIAACGQFQSGNCVTARPRGGVRRRIRGRGRRPWNRDGTPAPRTGGGRRDSQ